MKHHQTLFCRNHCFQSESFTVYLPPPALPSWHSSAVSSPWKTLHFTHRPFNGPSRCQPTCPLANGHSCSPHGWDFLTLHSLPLYFCFSFDIPISTFYPSFQVLCLTWDFCSLVFLLRKFLNPEAITYFQVKLILVTSISRYSVPLPLPQPPPVLVLCLHFSGKDNWIRGVSGMS